jgi:hypothetical protein
MIAGSGIDRGSYRAQKQFKRFRYAFISLSSPADNATKRLLDRKQMLSAHPPSPDLVTPRGIFRLRLARFGPSQEAGPRGVRRNNLSSMNTGELARF